VLSGNEAVLRQKIKGTVLAEFQELHSPEAVAQHVKEAYLVAIASSFDPHTEFFSPGEREHFEAALSTQTKSYGIVIDESDGKLVIKQLIPGGPAWKSGEVHRDDQVLQLRFDNGESIDASSLSAEELTEMLEESEAASMAVGIKKTDGTVKTIILPREKIETEENSVKSFVLKGSKKIGYISLPDFYTSWDQESGSSCADDVAKEIVNLKKEQIEGLILDVRFNGGGSMGEALQLIGIFINEGPLVGVKESSGKPGFLKDPYRGTIYDGPMVVLINGQSASASEALAASLQDYNRAVIVGSTSYGKATIQRIFPMDTTAGERKVVSPSGFVKITIGKFYRLNGGTTQLNGVRPDVYLPDAFDVLKYKEKFVPLALPSDTINRNNYYKALPGLPSSQLAQQSSQRLNVNAGFNSLKSSLQQYEDFFGGEEQTVPLNLEAFEKWKAQYNQAIIGQEEKTENTTLFEVSNHGYEQQRLKSNSYAGEINAVFIKNLKQDMYIEEGFRVLTDLIQLNVIK
ncbi:MAG TPA: carboxy terminal-processing peptidase, partial [Chitinophagaceae bacterium]|nr:carboxy terminal-processing peptidase [Chitinophagaceae bacterium]